MTSAITDPARLLGRYYTPSFIVEAMLRMALDPLLDSQPVTRSWALTILDPSCGEGAFLLPLVERLKESYQRHGMSDRFKLTSHLFGVDVDRAALINLRRRLGSESGNDSDWETNLPWGDALTGPGFGEPTCSKEDAPPAPDLDWQAAFPKVAKAGGFDLVIGNPPYRRELSSKRAFERLKASPLGQRCHQPRLDLWAYFLHRGLDVLRPGGRLAFILPSYWTASHAAEQLIDRLQAETTLCEIVLLGNSPVFPNVSGRHLILSLVKGGDGKPCKVWDLSSAGKRLAHELRLILKDANQPRAYSVGQAELYHHHQLRLLPPDRSRFGSGGSFQRPLRERFDVRQGIVENPRRITRKMADDSGNQYRVGEGVFVLSAEELERLDLSQVESRLLRPYYRGTDIARYHLAECPSEWLLYLTRETATPLDAIPKIASHLARFRSLLENRREVKLGRIAWWHLHWPREEELFLAPRIVMPQMGRTPRFVYCARPAFVGFAMHVIRQRRTEDATDPISLRALTGVLNSEWAAAWFWREAKHRGAALDISGGVLSRFPLPKKNVEAESALASLVRMRQALPLRSPGIPDLESEIERLVCEWYSENS